MLSIQVGRPRDHPDNGAGRPWRSAIVKRRVEGPVWLGRVNLAGDAQADLKNHGGPDKAVLAYAHASYAYWAEAHGLAGLEPGAFGENFTVAGQSEADVCIGDIYDIGGARVQVSQPRIPCWKLALHLGVPDMVRRVSASGLGGWYLRVLREGWVKAGQAICLVDRPCPRWNIAAANDVVHGRAGRAELAELVNCRWLSASLRQQLAERL
ncbi:MAG TPA: MOSC domain-containing protein [Bacillota bacterium]